MEKADAGVLMTDAARAAAAPYADRIWKRLLSLTEQGTRAADVTGAQLFPDSPPEQRAWDVFAERHWLVPVFAHGVGCGVAAGDGLVAGSFAVLSAV